MLYTYGFVPGSEVPEWLGAGGLVTRLAGSAEQMKK